MKSPSRRLAAPAPSDATRKPYYLHWFTADPFNRVVVLVVGDYKASFKTLDHTFKLRPNLPKADRVPFSDGLAECLEENPPKGDLEHCGRTVHRKAGDVFVWFPVFPTPGTLAHELMHAKDYILNSAGVTDTSGETDAYLLGQMYDHFFAALEKDKKHRRDASDSSPMKTTPRKRPRNRDFIARLSQEKWGDSETKPSHRTHSCEP